MDESFRSIFYRPHQLDYTIHSCSNCSSNYHPFNILEDAPTEPSSRWSGSGPPNPSARPIDPNVIIDRPPHHDSHPSVDPHSATIYPNQLPKKKDYIIIDLGKPAIVRSITFGKFHRPHPCNVKLFRIWGSLAPGEGKGDFRALLESQPSHPTQSSSSSSSSIASLSHSRRFNSHSIFKHHPSQSSNPQSNSSSHPNHSKLLHLNSNSTHSNDPTTQAHYKNLSHHPSFHPIRVRGERHPAGPRMELLAQGELKNDPVPETVPLRRRNDQVAWFKSADHHDSASDLEDCDSILLSSNQTVVVPVRYIKIEPLSAAGSNYNCSIWHVAVKGHDQEHILRPCLENYEKWRAAASLRLCLKHLRQAGHFEAFQALVKSAANPFQSPVLVPPSSDPHLYSSSQPQDPSDETHQSFLETLENSTSSHSAQFHFEHSLVSALHSALVPNPEPRFERDRKLGLDFTGQSSEFPVLSSSVRNVEQIVIQAAAEGLFDGWARAEPPTLTCHQIRRRSMLHSELPCPRGGHQMCIDSKRRKIWLFGGFDGFSDLGDLWVYHLEPPNLSSQGGSSPPCSLLHDDAKYKGVIGAKSVLGNSENPQTYYNRWQRISHDVKQENGPMNRSCHKMVVDELTGDLYVLGRYTERTPAGNIKSPDPIESTTNANSSRNNDLLTVQAGRASNSLAGSDNRLANPEVAPTDATGEFTDRIILDALRLARQSPGTVQAAEESPNTPKPDCETDELMTNGETRSEPPGFMPPTTGPFQSDMFRFQPFKDPSTDELWVQNGRVGRWECLSQDTFAQNGPKLIFDHQMVLDSERRKMYVFGGKIIQPNPVSFQDSAGSSSQIGSSQYSGLFEYDLTTRTWLQLMVDPGSSGSASTHPNLPNHRLSIPSRMGHSLILDKKRQCLWVLTGERDHHYFSDIWKYDIVNQRAQLVIADYTHGGKHRQISEADDNMIASAPEAGFSQRTTFDPEADEWHMFCGLCRDRGSGEMNTKTSLKSEMMSSEFWRWRVDEARWTKVLMKAQFDGTETPSPRFAHQMAFDSLTKTHYVFGGNPADNDNEPTRLGDFWKLKLIQPTRQEALRRCLFALRRQHFIEMCEQGADTVGALLYLQNDLSSVTNHSDERETRVFRACTSYLLAGPGPRMPLLEDDEELLEDSDCRIGEDGEDCVNSNQEAPDKWHDHNRLSYGGANKNGFSEAHHDEDVDMTRHNAGRLRQKIRDQRTQLFQDLLKFFPPSMTEPEESLMDLIDVWGDRETFW